MSLVFKRLRFNRRVSAAYNEIHRQLEHDHINPDWPAATLYSAPSSPFADERKTRWPELYDPTFRRALTERLKESHTLPNHEIKFYPPDEMADDWHCWVTPIDRRHPPEGVPL